MTPCGMLRGMLQALCVSTQGWIIGPRVQRCTVLSGLWDKRQGVGAALLKTILLTVCVTTDNVPLQMSFLICPAHWCGRSTKVTKIIWDNEFGKKVKKKTLQITDVCGMCAYSGCKYTQSAASHYTNRSNMKQTYLNNTSQRLHIYSICLFI